MLRFLGKATASMARSGGSSPSEVCVSVDDGLSSWELVNASQSDDEELYSYDSDDVIRDGDGVISDSEGVIKDESDPNSGEGEVGDDDDDDVKILIQALSVSPPVTFPVEITCNFVRHDYEEKYDNDDELRDVEDDDDDDVYDDVDDELVPWKLKDRFGKQRIKKMGKRGGPKLSKSKTLPYYDNRPGFQYGKFRGRC